MQFALALALEPDPAPLFTARIENGLGAPPSERTLILPPFGKDSGRRCPHRHGDGFGTATRTSPPRSLRGQSKDVPHAFLVTDFRLQNHLMHTNVRAFMARALTSQNLTDAFDVPATQFVRGVLHRTVPPFLHGASL